jgi:NAD(P)-dependent dehydrogenase (short-subunit alcohol dehydrogenase family)
MTNAPTALITGGTSGIGRATANKLALLGIHVLVVGRSMERGEKAVPKFAQQEVKRISFRPTFEPRRVHAKWQKELSSSETATSIF